MAVGSALFDYAVCEVFCVLKELTIVVGRSHEVYLRLSEKMVKALLSMCEELGIDSSGKVGTPFCSLC